jgi:hypothetical protein
MTSQSPRIYLYKITFEEVPYYYYGVHKEKKFDEYYVGTPVTHKWCWELYTPKKQIQNSLEYLLSQKLFLDITKDYHNSFGSLIIFKVFIDITYLQP